MRTNVPGVALGAAIVLAGSTASSAAPLWTAAPTYWDAVQAYPKRARAAKVGGDAVVSCTLNVTAHLQMCGVLGEAPEGYGFGNAARQLAQQLRAARGPEAQDGTELRVSLSFHPEMLGPDPYVATDPVWIDLPTAEDFRATFPTDRGANTIRVSMVCDVAPHGLLAGCVVERETPAGQGFGAAALALAPKIRVGLLAADGTPIVGAKVKVPLRYELSADGKRP